MVTYRKKFKISLKQQIFKYVCDPCVADNLGRVGEELVHVMPLITCLLQELFACLYHGYVIFMSKIFWKNKFGGHVIFCFYCLWQSVFWSLRYLKGINFSRNLFSRTSFFRNFAEKMGINFCGFSRFYLKWKFRGNLFSRLKGNRKFRRSFLICTKNGNKMEK